MSFKTWQKKYYPVPATAPTTMLGALKHALRKWRGLQPSILKTHGLKQDGAAIHGDNMRVMTIDMDSCAVCIAVKDKCKLCPLYKVRGVRCDGIRVVEIVSPYYAFSEYGDPIPMIGLLHEAIE